jgi:3-hydroxymyristoyl/3-hydroxydecanoyl-(acyl carrier protein) dehydratase
MHEARAAAIESTHLIDSGLRAFDGHFPGAPVLPGAYLLALVLHELERHATLRAPLGPALQVQLVKFLAPVTPGQTLRIRLQPQAQAIDFSVHRDATLVARGRVTGSAEAAAA